MDRWWRWLLALGLAASGLAWAEEPLLHWPQRDVEALAWDDPTGQATLADAVAAFEAGRGRPVQPAAILPLGKGYTVWYRLILPQVEASARAVLTVPYPGLDRVQLFRPAAGGTWHRQVAGDAMPVAHWPLRHLHPAFAFTLQPGNRLPSYLSVQHSHPIAVSWVLRDAGGFTESAKLSHLVLGAFIGFVLLVVLLSVVNAVSWRDPIHLYYGGHVLLIGLSLMALSGLAGEYMWPHDAWWNDIASVVIPTVGTAWLGLFVQALVGGPRHQGVRWLLRAHVVAGCAIALVFLLQGRSIGWFRVQNLYILGGLFLLLSVLVAHARHEPRSGWWVVAGMATLTVGALFPLLRNLGFLPVNFATQHGPEIGWALEIPLVLVGLYHRSRARRDNRLRLHAVARTDPLTGVASRRVLEDRLAAALSGLRPASAVLRVRVSNLERIRNECGREASEAALVRAAECVAREARDVETVGREGGGDLVLVLERPAGRDEVADIGRNIIARGLKFSRMLPPGTQLTLKVAGLCAPLTAADAGALLDRLEHSIEALAEDPHRGLRLEAGDGASRVSRPPSAVVRSLGPG